MTKIDEAIAMYPSTLMANEHLEAHRKRSEQVIFALRRWLRSTDETLPDIYDGTAWYEFEEKWIAPKGTNVRHPE